MAYVKVVENEFDDALELPLEEDGTLTLSTLTAQFASSTGLKYRAESGAFRALKTPYRFVCLSVRDHHDFILERFYANLVCSVPMSLTHEASPVYRIGAYALKHRLSDGKIHPPPEGWNNLTYVAVFPKESATSKRKLDDQSESVNDVASKPKRSAVVDSVKKCSDLIVLGLPYKTTSGDLKTYFGQFGEVTMAQVKTDTNTGKAKGYGFIHFAEYESQAQVLAQKNHEIEGRPCVVRIPDSKGGNNEGGSGAAPMRKIFVGRVQESITAEDLKEHFSQFGDVIDVYIAKPFRGFAFVTFSDENVAQQLIGEEYIVKGSSIVVSSAAPKVKNPPQPGPGDRGAASTGWAPPAAPAAWGNYGYGGGYYPGYEQYAEPEAPAPQARYYSDQAYGRAPAGGGGPTVKSARTSKGGAAAYGQSSPYGSWHASGGTAPAAGGWPGGANPAMPPASNNPLAHAVNALQQYLQQGSAADGYSGYQGGPPQHWS